MAESARWRLAAGLTALGVLAVYWPMLPAGVAASDTAEAQTVPYILGIPHPTGFPAFILAGWVFTHALPFGSVAWRTNVFTALLTALTTAGVVLLARALGALLLPAVAAALAFAFGYATWNGALHANAQVLATTLTVAALIGAVSFTQGGDRRRLYAACVAAGLGIATHPVAVFVTPALVLAGWLRRRDLAPRAAAFAALAFALPLVVYAYLPLRSAVVFADGLDPTAAPPIYGSGTIDWDTHQPRTLNGFLDEVLGRNEGAGGRVLASFDPTALRYITAFWLNGSARQYPRLLLVLAALGAAALLLRVPRALAVVLAGTVGGVLFAFAYRTDANAARYLSVSFAVVASLAASSTVALGAARVVRPAGAALAVILTVLAASSFAHNRWDMIDDPATDGQRIIDAVRADVPDGAIVVAAWPEATALGYGATVEHALGARTIVAGLPLPDLARERVWARARPVILFLRGFGDPSGSWPASPGCTCCRRATRATTRSSSSRRTGTFDES